MASAAITPNRESAVHLHIKPSPGWVSLRLKDLWEYRELLYFFVWRDIKVRYKQTALGALWAIIQPLFTMLIFSLFFGRLARIPSDGVPYPLFAFTALVPWTFFVYGLSQSADSLIGNGNLIKKIYFPRLAMPLSSVSAGLVDFSISFCFLLAMMMVRYGRHPGPRALWVPCFLLLAFVTCLGAGFWLSALNVRFRDVKHALPFLTQFWMYATPIAYPSSLLHGTARVIYGINPMAGVVEGFRWALLGTKTAPGPMIFVSAAVSVTMVITGAYYFRRMEKSFADVV